MHHLKVFGCICYSHIPKDEHNKLNSKAKEAIEIRELSNHQEDEHVVEDQNERN